MRTLLIIVSVLLLLASGVFGFLIFRERFASTTPPPPAETEDFRVDDFQDAEVEEEFEEELDLEEPLADEDEFMGEDPLDEEGVVDEQFEEEIVEEEVFEVDVTAVATVREGYFSQGAMGSVVLDADDNSLEFNKAFSAQGATRLYLNQDVGLEGAFMVGVLDADSGAQRYTISDDIRRYDTVILTDAAGNVVTQVSVN